MPTLVIAACLICLLLAGALMRARLLYQDAMRLAATDRDQMQDLTRLARLTAADLRATALSLLGHAETLASPQQPPLLAAEAALRELAEALLRQTDDEGAGVCLREEVVHLGPLVTLAVARVANQLAPGKRDWRLATGMNGIDLLADRRAIYETLMRVLTSAALATKDGDGIQISIATQDHGWALIVQDEGTGLSVDRAGGDARDTRGLGVGLSLAHGLMRSHGGTLTLESTAGIGTRAILSFPPARLVRQNAPENPVSALAG